MRIKGNLEIGGSDVIVMAGPCAIENKAQIHAVAKTLKSCGIKIMRGGAFKPRTSPYTFQGLGQAGLELMREVADEYGLFIVTEALSVEQVPLVYKYTDIIQIGTRNMQHFPILWAVGETDKPVLLKRGFMNTIDEVAYAAEHIKSRGNQRVIICERGIRTFDTKARFTLDLSAIPILKSMTGLPVIADPSHAAGHTNLVIPLALGALAAGADGLLVEVHPNNEIALSDGQQSLPLELIPEFILKAENVVMAIGRQMAK
ncbi:MAG: 3-deoxy-7-phosphoheptulonate synthase [Chloroflexi bacterium]|nr:3-deoxy-7-phosphoheptulonate synthase [Chloroflexota bacterium]